MTYLVKLKPLEEYTLGTELGFTDDQFHGGGRSSYIATSSEVPDQTTLLGVVRYMLLKNSGLLKPNFHYSGEERAAMAELIGPESFDFEKKDQTFGGIRELSPVFLIKDSNGTEQYIVPTPACLKEKDGTFSFMQMSGTGTKTNGGKTICLPEEGEYDPKKRPLSDWYNLNAHKPEDGLFFHGFLAGNRKAGEEDSYFKRETVRLAEHVSFAFFVTLEDGVELKDTLCRIGKKGALFAVLCRRAKNDLEGRIKAEFRHEKKWRYALSDILPEEDLDPDAFSVIRVHKVRNLSGKAGSHREKGRKRYSLIRAGSVFYEEGKMFENSHCLQIGYNKVIEIGGES